jgi:hypothetical protein
VEARTHIPHLTIRKSWHLAPMCECKLLGSSPITSNSSAANIQTFHFWHDRIMLVGKQSQVLSSLSRPFRAKKSVDRAAVGQRHRCVQKASPSRGNKWQTGNGLRQQQQQQHVSPALTATLWTRR